MRWRKSSRRSENIDDRRGRRAVRTGAGLGGGALLLVLVVALLTGRDPSELGEMLSPQVSQVDTRPAPGGQPSGPQDEMADFTSLVLADTEDTWSAIFAESGKRYQPPTLVLFNDAVQSACGFNSAAVGPFYCPADQKVYLDLGFFRELHQRFKAPGDFAQAYVISHEIGHHVQNLLGISDQVQRMRARASRAQGNALSVRLELQADCFSGVWAHHAHRQRQVLEQGDVEEGLNAAAAIGDDRLQRQSGGYVQPESWTHGSSEQRVRWFHRGLEHGRLDVCDTFSDRSL